ncbi:hypothetical protein JTB14_036748 [Gonioctena quinquepunctata]|nr:hypothetical protein JTB14_036748 [Gonioctena quinquepunctata]
MALWNTLGDVMEGSGWTTAPADSDLASYGKAESYLKAAHLSRIRHAHQITLMALHNLQHEAFLLSECPKDEESEMHCRNSMRKKSPTFMY